MLSDFPVDDIAREYSTDLDRIYPPMQWTAKWSDGTRPISGTDRHPRIVVLMQQYGKRTTYSRGLWLVSHGGNGILLPELPAKYDGRKIMAWSAREAVVRMRRIAAIDAEAANAETVYLEKPRALWPDIVALVGVIALGTVVCLWFMFR